MLITVEGIDGSGKSAVCQSLREAIPDAVFTAEPTDSWYGDAVRRSVQRPDADPLAELFLYTADHADHLQRVIHPALAAGESVISDRYVDSRYAYQGAALTGQLEAPVEFVREIHTPWTRHPDLTIYLDVSPSVGVERSGATNKFERESFLRSVAERYEQLIAEEPDRFRRVDGERAPATVAAEVSEIVTTAMAK